MRENYGLYSFWDVNNNCFVAYSPDFALCWGRGRTHAEAVAALDVEVQNWVRTGHELAVDVSYALPVTQEQAPPVSDSSLQAQEVLPKKPTKTGRNSPMKALREALAAAQEAVLSAPLDFQSRLIRVSFMSGGR